MMTYRARVGVSPDVDMAAVPNRSNPSTGRSEDFIAFGQSITVRLFAAGLDLNSALMRIESGHARSDDKTADGIRHAIAEVDEAIKELRHLMLTAWPETCGFS
jgi:hypothetical protein